MKISEIHNRLNRRCIVAISQTNGIFSVLARSEKTTPVYIFNDKDVLYLRLFFLKDNVSNSAISPILSRKDLIENRSYYTITEKIKSKEQIEIIKKLIESPSVALNNTYLLKNEIFIDFRFHNEKLNEINDILAEFMGNFKEFRIVSMTNSLSLRKRMDELTVKTPLAVIKYTLRTQDDNSILRYIKATDPDSVAEVQGGILSNKGVKVILYTSKPLDHKGVSVVSLKDNIYEAFVKESVLEEGLKLGNNAGIPRLAFFLTVENGIPCDTTFVPVVEADEYISLMMNSRSSDKRIHPILQIFSSLDDEDVWKWL